VFAVLVQESGNIHTPPANSFSRKKFGAKVGFERVLSGQGLVNIYDFLRDSGEYGKETAAQVISETRFCIEHRTFHTFHR